MPEKSQEVIKDDLDLTLNESQQSAEALENINESTTQETSAVEEDAETPVAKPESLDEVIVRLKSLAEKDADEISRDEVSYLKQAFYAIQKAETNELRRKHIEAGNEPDSFVVTPAPEEEALKDILNVIREKKAARLAEVEASRQKNFEAKEKLIEEILKMAADTDNVNREFPRFREIQQEFKAIGDVAPQQMSDQWKKYQDAVELFYDQLKVNKDLRDYDFKKNLDTKLHLCDEAEQLAAEEDIITAFKRLQDLHIKWRETGPVAKEVRQEIWDRFKDASAIINKKYQAFFEERKQREQENEAAKTAICERLEALDFDALKTYAEWNAMTDTILQAQAEWKTLGFASKKANNLLFARFRELCDRFFAMKADFFKKVKDDFAQNLEKKTALCEQAEALKDSTAWKSTADKLVALQKEWKTIGAVPKKQSDAIWERFMAACDYFFERKKKDYTETRQTEQANLAAKRALAEKLKAIPADAQRQEVLEAIKQAQSEWQQIGHVPFREKDKVYQEFRNAINELYAKHDLRENRANMARFETSLEEMGGDENKLYRERERLARVLETKRSELTTYQNNLGFFNFKSANASSLQRDIERKTRRLQDDITEIENKIKAIDERL